MFLMQWLRSWTARAERPGHTARFRPRLEILEGRALPSTLTVLNSADSGAGSLRDTIAAAHSGDTITFAPSVTGVNVTSGELVIDKSLTIAGPGANSDHLSISTFGPNRVFDITNSSAAVVLSNLDIDGGVVDHGGAILNQGGNLTLSGCLVAGVAKGSTGGQGGCIDTTGGTLAITGSFLDGFAVVQPQVVNGDALGGCISSEGGNVSVTNTHMVGSANNVPGTGGRTLGGAIYLGAGNLSLNSCLFDSDAVTCFSGLAAGGAVYQAGGAVTVNNCVFSQTYAQGPIGPTPSAGGAIYSAAGDLTINNSTFVGAGAVSGLDQATGLGGAICKLSGNLTINNSVFQLCAGVDGGAVSVIGGTATIANCDFSGNDSYNIFTVDPSGGALFVAGGSLTVSNCTFEGNGIDPNGGFTTTGTAIDVVAGAVSISRNTFTGHDPLTGEEVVGPYLLN
jgi:hypothetical protein